MHRLLFLRSFLGLSSFKKRIWCHYPYGSIFVTLDGAVRSCCFAQPIGNINQNELREIWNTTEAQNQRSKLLEGDIKGAGCETCGFINRRDIETFPYDETFGQTESIKRNIQRQRKEYLSGKAILKCNPSHVVVQVTEACNYECTMCFQAHRPESMDEETFTRSLSGIETLDEIQFTGGEPFLSKPVQRFLRAFDISTGQKLSFTTNGSLLHMFRKELERLPRLHLGLSIDAATEATYEKIRKGGDWAQIKENVEWFAAARKERYRGWKTSRLAFVVMKSNYEEIPLFVEWAASLGMPVLFAPVWGEFAPGENIYSHPELQVGLTPPEQILDRVELATKMLPDREREETIKSLRESLNQLTQAASL